MFLLQPCPSPPPAPKDPDRPAPRLLQGFADVPASTWFRWPGCSRVLKTSCVSSAREGRGSWAAASSCPCPSITPSWAAFSSHRPVAQVSKERPGGERGVLCEHMCVSHLVGDRGPGGKTSRRPLPFCFSWPGIGGRTRAAQPRVLPAWPERAELAFGSCPRARRPQPRLIPHSPGGRGLRSRRPQGWSPP